MPNTDDYDDDTPPAAPEQGRSAESDRLREIADKIQVGDVEEGAKALGEMLQIAEERGRRSVGQAMANVGVQAQNNGAVNRFASRFPVLQGDEGLANAAIGVVCDEIRRDLRTVGVSDKDLDAIGDNAEQLGTLHGHARSRGLKVRDADPLLDQAGARLTRDYNIHEGREGVRRAATARHINAQRVARGFAPVEGIGPQTAPVPAAVDADKEKARKIINDARRARGFTVYE